MLKRATSFVFMAALFLSMGAHLPVLQTAAWARMTIVYAQNDSIGVAVRKTLDGRRPCKMCRKIKKAAQAGPSLGTARSEHRCDVVISEPFAFGKTLEFGRAVTPADRSFLNSTTLPDFPPPRLLS